MLDRKTHSEHPLFLHIQKFTDLGINDFQEVLTAFNPRKVRKKENLMLANTICDTHFFVVKGCLNMYYINDDGSNQTVQFAIENWWLTDYLAFMNERKTDFYIQAVVPSTVLGITHKDQESLLNRFPTLEKYFRKLFQIAYGAALMRTRYQYELTKEQNYVHFTQTFPDFAQRVPQYLIASYLGLTPEYVSQIRKKQFS